MYSSTSNAARSGAPASFQTQLNYHSGTANTVTSKQVFASLPQYRRQTASHKGNLQSFMKKHAPKTDFQVIGTTQWGNARGSVNVNGASVLASPSVMRDQIRGIAQFARSDVAPNKGEIGIPIKTALPGGGGDLETTAGIFVNRPSVFDVSQDAPDKWRMIDAEARANPDPLTPIPEGQDTSARVTGMEALIHSLIQGKPSTNGIQMLERNPQMQTFLGPIKSVNGIKNSNGEGQRLASWSTVYNGLNNVRGQAPYQHQVNPIVMADINADFYSQLF